MDFLQSIQSGEERLMSIDTPQESHAPHAASSCGSVVAKITPKSSLFGKRVSSVRERDESEEHRATISSGSNGPILSKYSVLQTPDMAISDSSLPKIDDTLWQIQNGVGQLSEWKKLNRFLLYFSMVLRM